MGNIITLNDNSDVSDYISMSNGLTSVFISTFGLSGSRIAKSDH